MPNLDEGGYAFVILLRDSDDATGLARLLEDVRLPHATTPSYFVAPPVRGVDFFADEASQARLDQWWAANIKGNALPIYLLDHENSLDDWIKGVDGTFYIGMPNPGVADQYGSSAQIKTFLSGGPLDFASVIMRDFSGGNGSSGIIFDEGEALRMAALSSDFPIDLSDSAFDFGDSATAPTAAPPPRPIPDPGPSPSQFEPQPTTSVPPVEVPAEAANPFDSFASALGGGPSPFGEPQEARQGGFGPGSGPTPVAPRKKSVETTTAHPFDLMSSSSGGAVKASRPAPHSTPRAELFETPLPSLIDEKPKAAWPASERDSSSEPATTRPQAGYSAPVEVSSGRGRKNRAKVPKISLPNLSLLGKRGSRGGFVETPPRELANLIVDRAPTIVVMGSRKGGVGKTSYAAGIAVVAGTLLDTVGHKAAIVDANIANPDAWGQMNLREGAATVRETVAALTTNHEPPPPIHSTTPALAVYPESRETTEYSKTDIKRLADYLRRRFAFIVVDMSNRLPDPMAGPEAAVAAYWLEHADVLVLPTTSSKQDFNGVLDYLDVHGLPPTVVPYIIPKVKKNREHPVTQRYLTEIRGRVHSIVNIPDEADKVRFAGMEGVPVEQVSSTLKAAYHQLTEVIVRVPPRART